MFNKKRSSLGTSYSNDNYESDNSEDQDRRYSINNDNTPDIDLTPTKSDLDEFISDLEKLDRASKGASSTNTLSDVSMIPRALEGITEEITHDGSPDFLAVDTKNLYNKRDSSEPTIGLKVDNAMIDRRSKSHGNIIGELSKDIMRYVKLSVHNAREDQMSLSNFKKINMGFVPDEGMDCPEPIRRDMSYGSIIQMKEIHPEIHTGKRFRKCSALVVTPKVSDALNPYEASEDQLNIKVLDDSRTPQLFVEFDCLQINPLTNVYCWVEKSRWLRYEEDYDLDLKRFNSPHLSAMSLAGLTGFRKYFKKGDAILNCQSERYTDILKTLSDKISQSGTFSSQEIADIRNALVLKHYHAGDQMTSSLSDTSMFKYDYEKQCFEVNEAPMANNRKWSMASFSMNEAPQRKVSRNRMHERLDPNTEALSVQVGALDSFKHIFSLFVRLDPPIRADGLNEVNCPLRFIYILFGPKALEDELLEVGRVFSIMMSNPEFREVGYSAETKEEILEATTTFLQHSVIVPLTKVITNEALSAMLPQLKHYANYFTNEQNRKTFEEFKKEIHNKNQEIVINQCKDGVNRKISVNTSTINQGHLAEGDGKSMSSLAITGTKEEKTSNQIRTCCRQFCPPFKQFLLDFRGLKERYVSDFKDAFLTENISTVFIGMIFIYFVVLSPAITFGALFNQLISPKMSVSMCLVSSGFFQLFYTLVCGQPLEVVGITGPIYVVERVLGALSKSLLIELEVMRFWIGVYVSILGFLFTMFNGVMIIRHFRRSVEEVYNFFVGIIFILSALFTMFKALPYKSTPIIGNLTDLQKVNVERFKFASGGTTLFMAFLMLNFCLLLVQIKRGSFFRRTIRNLLGSFNVPLGIILIVAIERIFFQAFMMPTLNVPASNNINTTAWINPPRFSSVANASTSAHIYCFAISISLFFILITEVATNSISVTKVERKLSKDTMFSLNFFYILVVFPLISAFLGWPFVSGAMVRSNAHCIAMAKWSLNNLPGVSPKVIGAAEQRVSGIFVGTLVLLSVFLGSALRYIPMAAMYGMFLYMGVMGVRDLVVTRRVKNLFQLRKHWHQHDFLKDYPTWHIVVLCSFQGFFIAILVVLNCISEFTQHSWTPLIFPFFVGLYAYIRGYILPRWPRLNTHLSKMDKKHQVKLYEGKKPVEQIIITKDDTGVNMVVVAMAANEDDNDSLNQYDKESELDKELW